jgi:predicted transcriptional regulator
LDRLPIVHRGPAVAGETTKSMLKTIEDVFGPSASNMARILNVSRPMVYHYRDGMEPDVENKRRLQTISEVASEFRSFLTEPLTGVLKVEQPEGRTLLDVLSEEHLDLPAVRRLIQRNVKAADEALRHRFAEVMMKGQTAHERLDIVRERHKAGKPVVVGDPQSPGKVIQILPNGRRVRGRMVKRRFVPDEI